MTGIVTIPVWTPSKVTDADTMIVETAAASNKQAGGTAKMQANNLSSNPDPTAEKIGNFFSQLRSEPVVA